MKKVVHKESHDSASICKKAIIAARYAYIIVTIIGIIYGIYYKRSESAYMVIMLVSVVILIIIYIMTFYFNSLYCKGERQRRDYLIDNAFSTKLADYNSVEYYDTDDVDKGAEKCLADVNNSCFFSLRIIEKMVKKTIIKSTIVLIMFIVFCFIFIPNGKYISFFIQLLFSINVWGDVYYLLRLKKECINVLENCKRIWIGYKGVDRLGLDFNGLAIRELIRYETAITFSKIVFDKKIYEKNRKELDSEWNKIKRRYII